MSHTFPAHLKSSGWTPHKGHKSELMSPLVLQTEHISTAHLDSATLLWPHFNKQHVGVSQESSAACEPTCRNVRFTATSRPSRLPSKTIVPLLP